MNAGRGRLQGGRHINMGGRGVGRGSRRARGNEIESAGDYTAVGQNTIGGRLRHRKTQNLEILLGL